MDRLADPEFAVGMIVVLGATGTTGRRIARRLGPDVRPASRSTGFDLADDSTWAAALDGVESAYLIEPSVPMTGDRIPRLVQAAVDAGIRRLVFLSAGGIDHADHPLEPAEQAVRGSGLAWTILRPTWFMQNFTEGPWRQAILDGELALPAGHGTTPFIDADDIADVAVAALTGNGHAGEIYVLTGPRAVGFGEAVDLIASRIGRPARYVDVAPEEYVRRQVADGVPIRMAQLLTGILVAVREGHGGEVADGVERALGRKARSFEEFVQGISLSFEQMFW